MTESVIVVQYGSRWAIKHNGSFLGYAESQDQAAGIASDLQDYLAGKRQAAPLASNRNKLDTSAIGPWASRIDEPGPHRPRDHRSLSTKSGSSSHRPNEF